MPREELPTRKRATEDATGKRRSRPNRTDYTDTEMAEFKKWMGDDHKFGVVEQVGEKVLVLKKDRDPCGVLQLVTGDKIFGSTTLFGKVYWGLPGSLARIRIVLEPSDFQVSCPIQ